MLQPVSVGLKFGFLAVLYLFLIWVAWSAVRDLRRGRGTAPVPSRGPSPDETGMSDAAASGLGEVNDFEPRLLVERADTAKSGLSMIKQRRIAAALLASSNAQKEPSEK